MIHIDFETFSVADLPDVGAYRYAEDASTEVLILCWAGANGAVRRWLPHKDGQRNIPKELLLAAKDDTCLFWAHYAEFEQVIWNKVLTRHGWPYMPLHRWRCTAVLAAAANYPRSLDGATAAAGTTHRKDPRGKALIRKFCIPRKPTKADPSTRILPKDDPGAFEEFVEYCEGDVLSERDLHDVLPTLPEWEWDNYLSTSAMNDAGLPLDMELLTSSAKIVSVLEKRIHERTEQITGGLRATQRDKIMVWLENNGATLQNMQAESVRALWQKSRAGGTINLPPQTRELLELRIEASRASTKKLVSMRAVACADGRAHGTVMHYGAHTGRNSGKLIQPHNYKRGIGDVRIMSTVLRALRMGDAQLYAMLYDKPMEMLSDVIRGFIAAKEGKELLVVDYVQIEPRLADWHSGNAKGLKEWASGIDKYKLMASYIYGIPIEQITKEQRRIGKNATLGCVYGMSANAFLIYCHNHEAPEVDENMAELAVGTFRDVNEPVAQYWSDVETYAKAAIADPSREFKLRFCTFTMRKHWLTIRLPSGRYLHYPHAEIKKVKTKYGKTKENIAFDGMHGPSITFGSKLVENIVSATARDILFHGVRNAVDKKDYLQVGNVHDEGIFEEDIGKRDIEELMHLMCELPRWAKGCPITAEGYVSPFYRKG